MHLPRFATMSFLSLAAQLKCLLRTPIPCQITSPQSILPCMPVRALMHTCVRLWERRGGCGCGCGCVRIHLGVLQPCYAISVFSGCVCAHVQPFVALIEQVHCAGGFAAVLYSSGGWASRGGMDQVLLHSGGRVCGVLVPLSHLNARSSSGSHLLHSSFQTWLPLFLGCVHALAHGAGVADLGMCVHVPRHWHTSCICALLIWLCFCVQVCDSGVWHTRIWAWR